MGSTAVLPRDPPSRRFGMQEQQKFTALASRVKVPNGALHIRGWYVVHEAVVADACGRLGIGDTAATSGQRQRVVGLAEPDGAGKCTIAVYGGRINGRAGVLPPGGAFGCRWGKGQRPDRSSARFASLTWCTRPRSSRRAGSREGWTSGQSTRTGTTTSARCWATTAGAS